MWLQNGELRMRIYGSTVQSMSPVKSPESSFCTNPCKGVMCVYTRVACALGWCTHHILYINSDKVVCISSYGLILASHMILCYLNYDITLHTPQVQIAWSVCACVHTHTHVIHQVIFWMVILACVAAHIHIDTFTHACTPLYWVFVSEWLCWVYICTYVECLCVR